MDLTTLSASELAARLARGELSAREVVERHIERIEQLEPRLGAVVVCCFDSARRDAEARDRELRDGGPMGPLHGVPVSIKECFHVAGTPSCLGVPARKNILFPADSPHVTRLKNAGAVVLCKTNLSQLMFFHESDNPVYGRANNPHNLERTPGGSSGGEGALVAAYGSPLGLGSDLGGSIRIPAHFCGVAGFKPTDRRLTRLGCEPGVRGQLGIEFQPGPLARTVEDLELAMRVLTDSSRLPLEFDTPPVPWRSSGEVDLAALRVAVWEDDGFFTPAPAVRRGVREAANRLQSQGVQIESFAVPDAEEAFILYLGLLSADGGADLRRSLAGGSIDRRLRYVLRLASLPRPIRNLTAAVLKLRKQPKFGRILRSGGVRSADDYWRLCQRQKEYRRRFFERLDELGFDACLCPPYALPAIEHGRAVDLLGAASYAFLPNLLGAPCGSVPITRVGAGEESDRTPGSDWTEQRAQRSERGTAGLPIGVQIIGRPWRDDVVLRLMRGLTES